MLLLARPAVFMLVLALAIVAGAGQPGRASTRAHASGGITLELELLTTGLSSPSGVVSAGDNRLFVVEQTGLIRIYDDTQNPKLLATPFLDVSGIISCCTERGLLGLAFHPRYASNGRFFIHYTESDGDIVIARVLRSAGNPNLADPATRTTLLTIPHQTAANHNGGQLQFGPDGNLYIAIGDGGGEGDPEGNGQDLGTLLGKILRINVDGAGYTVPASNPFVSNPTALDEIWAWGLRNPWRFAFDRVTGDMFIGDVGQYTWEEIDFQPAASAGGENYGWNTMEGAHCYPAGTPTCNQAGLMLPILEYGHGAGDCSITGGYRYRGSASPSLMGTYVYGDFCSGRIWGATLSGTWSFSLLIDSPLYISSFGEDEMGELYATDYFGGALYQLIVLIVPDTDGDGISDDVDNCVSIPNPGQEQSDKNFIDLTPPKANDDLTWINSDPTGDACDTEDDNDGLSDSAEAIGCNGTGPTSATLRDTDVDRYLDNAECVIGSNPANAASKPTQALCIAASGAALSSTDTDGDGVKDYVEYCFYNSDKTLTDTDGTSEFPLSSPPPGPLVAYCSDGREVASVDDNRTVNAADLGLVASAFGSYTAPPAPGTEWKMNMDVDKNGTINAADLGLVAARFGACP